MACPIVLLSVPFLLLLKTSHSSLQSKCTRKVFKQTKSHHHRWNLPQRTRQKSTVKARNAFKLQHQFHTLDLIRVEVRVPNWVVHLEAFSNSVKRVETHHGNETSYCRGRELLDQVGPQALIGGLVFLRIRTNELVESEEKSVVWDLSNSCKAKALIETSVAILKCALIEARTERRVDTGVVFVRELGSHASVHEVEGINEAERKKTRNSSWEGRADYVRRILGKRDHLLCILFCPCAGRNSWFCHRRESAQE